MGLAFFSVGTDEFFDSVRVFHGARAIQKRQQHEHESLDDRNQDAQAQDGQRREKGAGQHEEHGQQDLLGEDVAEKTKGKSGGRSC